MYSHFLQELIEHLSSPESISSAGSSRIVFLWHERIKNQQNQDAAESQENYKGVFPSLGKSLSTGINACTYNEVSHSKVGIDFGEQSSCSR